MAPGAAVTSSFACQTDAVTPMDWDRVIAALVREERLAQRLTQKQAHRTVRQQGLRTAMSGPLRPFPVTVQSR